MRRVNRHPGLGIKRQVADFGKGKVELVAVFVGNVLCDGAIDGLFRQTADDNQDVLHDVLLNKWGRTV